MSCEREGEDGRELTEASHRTDHHMTPTECDRQLQCGIGPWRPSWLQRFANMPTFTATLSLWMMFCCVHYSYYPAVITQIEKQFGLPSSVTGFVKNVDNIGYMLSVLFVTHLCRDANKPRLFSIATIISASGIFIFGIPGLVFGRSDSDAGYHVTNSTNQSQENEDKLCDGLMTRGQFCEKEGRGSMNVAAVAIFVISELISGAAEGPKYILSLVFTDDNAKEGRSPLYMGFMLSVRTIAPVIAYSLGALANSIYFDLSDPALDQKDPRWIGAWWIGFVVCAACSVVWVVPIILFPPAFRKPTTEKKEPPKQEEQRALADDNQVYDEDDAAMIANTDTMTLLKDLPKAICRLAKNAVVVLLGIQMCVDFYIWGYFTFVPKYLEQYYGMTASLASIYTGVVISVPVAVGPIISGTLMSWRRWRIKETLIYVIVVMSIATASYTVMLFVTCPNQEWAGHLQIHNSNLSMDCNADCSCEAAAFAPVHHEQLSYYSPCHAGCSELVSINGTKKFYGGCTCVEGGVAQSGTSPKQCTAAMITYLLLLFTCNMAACLGGIPSLNLLIRAVDHQDKGLAIGVVSIAMCITTDVFVGFPSAVVFGMVIDSACVVSQGGTCGIESQSGACLFYDEQAMRFNMHMFVIAIKGAGVIVLCVALYFGKDVAYRTRDGKIQAPEKDNKPVDSANNESELSPLQNGDHALNAESEHTV